jgi:hypothetical protein
VAISGILGTIFVFVCYLKQITRTNIGILLQKYNSQIVENSPAKNQWLGH